MGILCVYRWGSSRMTESALHALPGIKWLGARAEMLELCDGRGFQVSGVAH